MINCKTLLSSIALISTLQAYEYKSIFADTGGLFNFDNGYTELSIVRKGQLSNDKYEGNYSLVYMPPAPWSAYNNMLIFIPSGTIRHSFSFTRVGSKGDINGYLSLGTIPDPTKAVSYSDLIIDKTTDSLLNTLENKTVRFYHEASLNFFSENHSNYKTLDKWLYFRMVKDFTSNITRSVGLPSTPVADSTIISNTPTTNSLTGLYYSASYVLDKTYVDSQVQSPDSNTTSIYESCKNKSENIQKLCTYLKKYPVGSSNSDIHNLGANDPTIGLATATKADLDSINYNEVGAVTTSSTNITISQSGSDIVVYNNGVKVASKPISELSISSDINTNYISSLSKGWNLLGTSYQINSSETNSWKAGKSFVWKYDNGNWTSNDTEFSNKTDNLTIDKNQGFWLRRE